MNILLLECGRPPPSVDAHFGGFRRWFRDALPGRAVTVVTAYARHTLELEPSRFDRVIASGSRSSRAASTRPSRPSVSVLAPVGSALLGLSVGESIEWPVPGGVRRLRVVELPHQPQRTQT